GGYLMDCAIGIALIAALCVAPTGITDGPQEPDSIAVTAHAHRPPRALIAPSTSATNARIRPPGAAIQAGADAWRGEDKFRLAALSGAALMFVYSIVRVVHDDPDDAMSLAAAAALTLGVAKEIVDHRAGGPFSFRDLAGDAVGAGAAWLFL